MKIHKPTCIAIAIVSVLYCGTFAALGVPRLDGASVSSPSGNSAFMATGSYSVSIGETNYVTDLAAYTLIVGEGYDGNVWGDHSVYIGLSAPGENSYSNYNSLVVGVLYGSSYLQNSINVGSFNYLAASDSLAVGNLNFSYNAEPLTSGFMAGTNNVAAGQKFVLGRGINATQGGLSVVVGQYNKSVADAVFVIGNGTSVTNNGQTTVTPSNAFEVYHDGRIRMTPQGDISMGEFAP